MLLSVFSKDTNIRAWMGNYSFRKIHKEKNKQKIGKIVSIESFYLLDKVFCGECSPFCYVQIRV